MEIVAEWTGYCPICQCGTTFRARNEWFRDHLLCVICKSIPRERAVMLVLNSERPNWRGLHIHESSPVERGTSLKLKKECGGYVPTQYFPGVALGGLHGGIRCEDLEHQTFKDGSLDVIITQDVMEHVFDPAEVYREVYRTLRPGGIYIHTTPIHKTMTESVCCAERLADGTIRHLKEPEYHGNPIDESGSLVTFLWGYDLPEKIATWTPFNVEVRRFNDRRYGIVAELTEVIICRKQDTSTGP